MRLFVAINFPETVKEKLGFLVKELQQFPADIKWVGIQNFHLTIQFLGNVFAHQVPDIVTNLSRSVNNIDPFLLKLSGIGVFQSVERPRVLWMGISGETAALARLHEQVQRGLEQLGFEPERRRFSPHLTLARVRSPHGFPTIIGRAKELVVQQGEIGPANVVSIDLMLSELSSLGPTYSILSRISLV